jgi:Ca2+-transporting ATPase
MSASNFNIKGLTTEQSFLARAKYGQNKLNYKKENTVVDALTILAKEPMVVLLLAASIIYLISGQNRRCYIFFSIGDYYCFITK